MALVVRPAKPPAAVIKDGTYPATVSGIRTFANTYGERVGFEFTITGGPFDGVQVSRSTAPQLSAKSKLAEVISGIIGRELTSRELDGGFDLEELIDKPCSILVITNKSKAGAIYSTVERVFPS